MKNQKLSYHHFKGDILTPSEKVQRKVVEMVIQSRIPDHQRDTSKVFELKHSSEVIQMVRLLAQKRHLNMDISETIAALHDINVIVNGDYKDHAKRGAVIAKRILKAIGGFSDEDNNIIIEAVEHHSEKDIYSASPYVELIKDADVFVCSMYENSEEEYRRIKSPILLKHYITRIVKVRKELGLPSNPVFRK